MRHYLIVGALLLAGCTPDTEHQQAQDAADTWVEQHLPGLPTTVVCEPASFLGNLCVVNVYPAWTDTKRIPGDLDPALTYVAQCRPDGCELLNSW